MADMSQRWRLKVTAAGVVELCTEISGELDSNEARVEMRIAGVCGSDTHAYHGNHPQISLPYYPGHEVIGTVVEIGAEVTNVELGDRVIPEPTLPCGQCKTCQTGASNVCENLQFFGCGYREGGMAQTFTIPADRLRAVPAGFTDIQALLIEPLATPVHAARLAGDLVGRVVLIHGAGTIGLLMIAAARAAGARRIVVSDLLASKREIALAQGADEVIDASAEDFVELALSKLGETADVVFDCVAIQSTVDTSIRIVAKAGTVVMVGVPASHLRVDLPTLQDNQIRLQGAATYLTEDYERAKQIIRSGVVEPEVLVSRSFPYTEAQAAFDTASAGTEIKVAITG